MTQYVKNPQGQDNYNQGIRVHEFYPTGTGSVVSVDTLNRVLGDQERSDVTIKTSGFITDTSYTVTQHNRDLTIPDAGETGTIYVNADIIAGGNRKLLLFADKEIIINITSTDGTFNVDLQAGNSGSGEIKIGKNVNISLNAGSLYAGVINNEKTASMSMDSGSNIKAYDITLDVKNGYTGNSSWTVGNNFTINAGTAWLTFPAVR